MPFNCSVDAIANSDTMGCHYHWIINAYDKALIYIYIYIYIFKSLRFIHFIYFLQTFKGYIYYAHENCEDIHHGRVKIPWCTCGAMQLPPCQLLGSLGPFLTGENTSAYASVFPVFGAPTALPVDQ
jgi:hypothetical protein